MISASVGNSCIVIECAHDVWRLAAVAIEKLAIRAGGFPAQSPFGWNVNNITPELLIFMCEE